MERLLSRLPSREREVVRLLNGDCHSPIGAYALMDGDAVTLTLTATGTGRIDALDLAR